jgi:hypothetical protein
MPVELRRLIRSGLILPYNNRYVISSVARTNRRVEAGMIRAKSDRSGTIL